MKKITKTIAILTAALLCGTVVSAEYDPNKVVDPNLPYTTTALTKPIYAVTVGEKLLDVQTFSDGDSIMIPLRAVCEELGYTVEWNGEAACITLLRDTNYIQFYPLTHTYTFSKTASTALVPPVTVIIEGTTYVPTNFVTDVLRLTVAVDPSGMVTVTDAEAPLPVATTVTVIEVGADYILAKDDADIETCYKFDEHTTFAKDGVAATVADITVGATVTAEHSQATTMSLPPQTYTYHFDIAK